MIDNLASNTNNNNNFVDNIPPPPSIPLPSFFINNNTNSQSPQKIISTNNNNSNISETFRNLNNNSSVHRVNTYNQQKINTYNYINNNGNYNNNKSSKPYFTSKVILSKKNNLKDVNDIIYKEYNQLEKYMNQNYEESLIICLNYIENCNFFFCKNITNQVINLLNKCINKNYNNPSIKSKLIDTCHKLIPYNYRANYLKNYFDRNIYDSKLFYCFKKDIENLSYQRYIDKKNLYYINQIFEFCKQKMSIKSQEEIKLYLNRLTEIFNNKVKNEIIPNNQNNYMMNNNNNYNNYNKKNDNYLKEENNYKNMSGFSLADDEGKRENYGRLRNNNNNYSNNYKGSFSSRHYYYKNGFNEKEYNNNKKRKNSAYYGNLIEVDYPNNENNEENNNIDDHDINKDKTEFQIENDEPKINDNNFNEHHDNDLDNHVDNNINNDINNNVDDNVDDNIENNFDDFIDMNKNNIENNNENLDINFNLNINDIKNNNDNNNNENNIQEKIDNIQTFNSMINSDEEMSNKKNYNENNNNSTNSIENNIFSDKENSTNKNIIDDIIKNNEQDKIIDTNFNADTITIQNNNINSNNIINKNEINNVEMEHEEHNIHNNFSDSSADIKHTQNEQLNFNNNNVNNKPKNNINLINSNVNHNNINPNNYFNHNNKINNNIDYNNILKNIGMSQNNIYINMNSLITQFQKNNVFNSMNNNLNTNNFYMNNFNNWNNMNKMSNFLNVDNIFEKYIKEENNLIISLKNECKNDKDVNKFFNKEFAELKKEYYSLKKYEKENPMLIKKNISLFEENIILPIYEKINIENSKRKNFFRIVYEKYNKIIKDVLSKKFPIEDIKIEPYGSIVNNFLIDGGDIDICITIPEDKILNDHGAYLAEIRNEIVENQQCGVASNFYNTDRFSILKIKDVESDIEIDMTMHTILNIKNTEMLRFYSLYEQRFHILGIFMKFLVKKNHINGANEKFLSSYALLILIIHFLQNTSPVILPNLQEITKNVTDIHTYYHGEKKLQTNLYYEKNIDVINQYMNAINEGKENNSSVGELLVEFLEYYCYKYNYNHYLISISKREKKQCDVKENIAFPLEDPFDVDYNPGKSMKLNTLQYFVFEYCMKKELNNILSGEYFNINMQGNYNEL